MSALETLADNASRLGARLQESIAERTRDLGGAAFFDSSEDKIKDIRRQLDSNSDREKLQGMKLLVAMLSKGRNVSEFFAQVVKNVASTNLEIRKLVYIYLLRYAESEPDLALLSINTFQKDLNDPNPLIRAMALRVLSGIRVPMIGSLVVLGIKKSAADPSPYVRKAAALSIPKCFSLDPVHQPALLSIVTSLLKDRSPLSVGAVAVAFNAVCPDRLDMLHQHYRRLCRLLVDADAWGQVPLLEILGRYARKMLSQPMNILGEALDPDLQLLLTSTEPLFSSRNPAVITAAARIFYYLGPRDQMGKIILPMLRLMHSSKEIERVVLTDFMVIAKENSLLLLPNYSRFFVLSTDLSQTKQSKLRILIECVTSDNVQTLLREFSDYANDADDVFASNSIEAIGHCARNILESTQQALSLLMAFIKSGHDAMVGSAIVVLKNLVQMQLSDSSQSLSLAPGQHDPYTIISQLSYRFDEIKHPQARACVLWLVGQYSPSTSSTVVPGIADWAPDVLRRAVKTFAVEPEIVKLQIINVAAKLLILLTDDNPQIHLLVRYVFSLARYDLNYDVRDRARMVFGLLVGVVPNLKTAMSSSQPSDGFGDDVHDENDIRNSGGVVLRREQVRLVLFQGKSPPEGTMAVLKKLGGGDGVMGSLGLLLGKDVAGTNNRELPDWPQEGTDASLRETEDDRPPPMTPSLPMPTHSNRVMQGFGNANMAAGSANLASPIMLTPTVGGMSPAGGSKAGFMNLDKFYASDSDDEDAEGGSEEEEDSEEVQERAGAQDDEVSEESSSDSEEEVSS